MWVFETIAETVADALATAERRLTDEQAVRGIDALDETDLHPILADGLAGVGYGVIREQPYPHEWVGKPPSGKRALPEHRDRLRCDLVLTPEAGQSLADPLTTVREADAILSAGAGTLFDRHAAAAAQEHAPPLEAVPPDEACWLEVKAVGQFAFVDGVPGPNGGYAGAIVKGVASDIAKLGSDELIRFGASVLVLFTRDAAVAEHDAVAVVHRCLDKGLPVGSPVVRTFAVSDRIGNEACTVVVVPVR